MKKETKETIPKQLNFSKKEINEHPRNSYAYIGLAGIYYDQKKYDKAFSEVTIAIKVTPPKDKQSMATAFLLKGDILLAIADTVGALRDYDKALKLDPKFSDVYEKRAQLFFEMGRNNESNADYNKLLELNPANYMGYMGLGRNAKVAENYPTAIKNFSKVIELEPEYSSGYSFRADCYFKQEKYIPAADDIMKALSIDHDGHAHWLISQFSEEQIPLLVAKLKSVSVKHPHDAVWQYYIAQLYGYHKKYSEGIDALQNALEIDTHSFFYEKISDFYEEKGNYAKAIEAINHAIDMDSSDIDLMYKRADLLGEAGDVEGAIAGWTEVIAQTPDWAGAYYRRGFFEDNSNRTDEALADYEMAIMLDPDYAYSYLGKGDLLMRKGEFDKAMKAYRKVVELDTVPSNSSCAMYAYLALGEKDKAIDFMNRVIEQDSINAGNYYDAACLYSRMGNLNKSMDYLRQSIEYGFSRFHHVIADDDLEVLRETDAFKDFYNEHKEQFEPLKVAELKIIDEDGNDVSNEVLSKSGKIEVPFTPEHGCASVKCSINDLPLTFVFDTGASIVSISQLEANFMLKNGYLKRDDIVGTGRFVDANGDVSEGTIIILREVEFGGLKLSNVKASVVRNQKAPLLLGQSVLGRLGSIEINNSNRKLIITR